MRLAMRKMKWRIETWDVQFQFKLPFKIGEYSLCSKSCEPFVLGRIVHTLSWMNIHWRCISNEHPCSLLKSAIQLVEKLLYILTHDKSVKARVGDRSAALWGARAPNNVESFKMGVYDWNSLFPVSFDPIDTDAMLSDNRVAIESIYQQAQSFLTDINQERP